MIDVIPARPEMLRAFEVQHAQLVTGMPITEDMLSDMIAAGNGGAYVSKGRILAMAGVYQLWEDRGVAWALLSPNMGASFMPVHRAILRALDVAPYRRVEMYAAAHIPEAPRWAKALGFQSEGVMRAFHGGMDYELFARVR